MEKQADKQGDERRIAEWTEQEISTRRAGILMPACGYIVVPEQVAEGINYVV